MCLAHGLHRICEKVRDCFEDVNKLIRWPRKFFLKTLARITLYTEKMKCELPPDVVVKRGDLVKGDFVFALHKFCRTHFRIAELFSIHRKTENTVTEEKFTY